jgi:hypothetical protein
MIKQVKQDGFLFAIVAMAAAMSPVVVTGWLMTIMEVDSAAQLLTGVAVLASLSGLLGVALNRRNTHELITLCAAFCYMMATILGVALWVSSAASMDYSRLYAVAIVSHALLGWWVLEGKSQAMYPTLMRD